ncbi:MAG: hypothetical protein Q9207_005773 [Kuettlingeria erythrocarpa]
MGAKPVLNQVVRRIVELEDEIESSIDSRNDALQTLRELGPPDLVHLVKQSVKSSKKARTLFLRHKMPDPNTRQAPESITGVYHHVTGVEASSSASLAAYVNTLTYNLSDKNTKIVSGLYWYAIVSCHGDSE